MTKKTCNKCFEEKPIKDFAKNKSSPDGFSSICKSCKNIQKKKYRKNNKEKIKKYTKDYYQENKEKLKEYTKKFNRGNLSDSS